MAELDPRQAEFLKRYLDPKSKTFSNALQSALKAGYSQDYAENITVQLPKWLEEKLGKEKLVKKAEKVLENCLDYSDEEPVKMKLKQDTAKFVASRLGKKNWSERQELTGKDGKDLPTPILGYVSKDNSNRQGDEPQPEDTSSTGGNIS